MAFEWFRNKSHVSQIICLLIILYGVSTIVVLTAALVLMSSMHRIFLNPYVTLTYAIISLALTIFISAYHLSTMIRRRKRLTDWPEERENRQAV